MSTVEMDRTSFSDFESHVEYVREVVANGGPDEGQYAEHLHWYSVLNHQIETGRISGEQRDHLRSLFADAYTVETMHGHAYAKPFGYAGDYLIIEKIYDRSVSPREDLRKFDLFFHAQDAPIAVRNRKEYFKRLVRGICERQSEPVRVLDIASGPCCEIKELFDETPDLPVTFVALDVDRRAIQYATQLLGKHRDRVTFIEKNVFRYKPNDKFSLIWSAGLFDYFDDRTFHRILSRFVGALEANGELVVGNFGIENPSRGYMEALANWYLHHRSDARLAHLAKTAGAESHRHRIRVGFEPTGVNRFLHIMEAAGKTIRWDLPHGIATPQVLSSEVDREQAQHDQDWI